MKFYNAAIELKHEREYEKAIRVLNLGIKKYQTAHVLYYQRGVIEQDYFRNGLSIKDFNTAISLSPRYDKAYFSRAKAYAKTGKIDKAMADLKKCVDINPKFAKNAQSLMEKILLGNCQF